MRLALLVSGVHGVGLIVPFTVPLPAAVRAALVLLVSSSLVRSWAIQVRHRGRAGIREVLWDGKGEWYLTLGNAEAQPARLLPSSYVSPWLVVLNFRVGRRWRNLLLLPDAVDPDLLRRLRVRLRMQAHAGSQDAWSPPR